MLYIDNQNDLKYNEKKGMVKLKKKLLVALTVAIVAIGMFAVGAFASRSTELPAPMTDYYGKEFYLDDLWFSELKLTGAPFYQMQLNMNFSFYTQSTDYETLWLNDFYINCFDANGNYLGQVPFPQNYGKYSFSESESYTLGVSLPDITAMIEIVSPKYNQTYLHCKYRNVYAQDGRVMAICDLQTPVYQTVGWYPGVMVYTEDLERELEISPFQVDAYSKVGWYTLETAVFKAASNEYRYYMSQNDYNSAIETWNGAEEFFSDYNYIVQCQAMRTTAMDRWRTAINSPVAITNADVDEDNDVRISFRNISYKPIAYIRLDFNCYDDYGNYINTGYDYYYVDDLYLKTLETDTYWWDYLSNYTNSVSNARITGVVFGDGTMWGSFK